MKYWCDDGSFQRLIVMTGNRKKLLYLLDCLLDLVNTVQSLVLTKDKINRKIVHLYSD